LLPPPFFQRYEADDLREFYLEFSRQMGKGAEVFLSNSPAVTSEIPVETAQELLNTRQFAGIEEGGDLESFLRMKAASNGSGSQVVMGSDEIFTAGRCAGGCCAISAAACAAPELMLALDRAISAGRQPEITKLNGELQVFLGWTRRFPAPVIHHVATELRGLKTGPVTVPISPAKRKLLDEFREWFQAWLPGMRKLSANA
jgi:dihydrodipicolinate synthase/N-acetylneuraminate lyase